MLSKFKKEMWYDKALQMKAKVTKYAALAIVRGAHDFLEEESNATDLEREAKAEILASEFAEFCKESKKLPKKDRDLDDQALCDMKINELNAKQAEHIKKRAEIIESYLKRAYTPKKAKKLTDLLVGALPENALVQARNALSRAINEKSREDRKNTVKKLKKVKIDLKKIERDVRKAKLDSLKEEDEFAERLTELKSRFPVSQNDDEIMSSVIELSKLTYAQEIAGFRYREKTAELDQHRAFLKKLFSKQAYELKENKYVERAFKDVLKDIFGAHSAMVQLVTRQKCLEVKGALKQFLLKHDRKMDELRWREQVFEIDAVYDFMKANKYVSYASVQDLLRETHWFQDDSRINIKGIKYELRYKILRILVHGSEEVIEGATNRADWVKAQLTPEEADSITYKANRNHEVTNFDEDQVQEIINVECKVEEGNDRCIRFENLRRLLWDTKQKRIAVQHISVVDFATSVNPLQHVQENDNNSVATSSEGSSVPSLVSDDSNHPIHIDNEFRGTLVDIDDDSSDSDDSSGSTNSEKRSLPAVSDSDEENESSAPTVRYFSDMDFSNSSHQIPVQSDTIVVEKVSLSNPPTREAREIDVFVYMEGCKTKGYRVMDSMTWHMLRSIIVENTNITIGAFSFKLHQRLILSGDNPLWTYGFGPISDIHVYGKGYGGMDPITPPFSTPTGRTVEQADTKEEPSNTSTNLEEKKDTSPGTSEVGSLSLELIHDSVMSLKNSNNDAFRQIHGTLDKVLKGLIDTQRHQSRSGLETKKIDDRLTLIEETVNNLKDDFEGEKTEKRNKAVIKDNEKYSDDSDGMPKGGSKRFSIARRSLSIAKQSTSSSGVMDTKKVDELLAKDMRRSTIAMSGGILSGIEAIAAGPSLGATSDRQKKLKDAELKENKTWYEGLNSLSRSSIRTAILYRLRDQTSRLNVTGDKVPQYILDGVLNEGDLEDLKLTESNIEYFIISSGYMTDDMVKNPVSKSNTTSSNTAPTMLISRQLDTIPTELTLNSNVKRLDPRGSVLYHLLNWKKAYERWTTFPGNTSNSVCLVYSVSAELLASILAAHCNAEILRSGGYNSQNVSTIPNDVFITLALRMVRPTTSEQFLKMLQSASRFPAYPSDIDPHKMLIYNFDTMIQLAYVYCDKIVDIYNLLCVDIISDSIIPSMYNRDENWKGLKGVFTNNFIPSFYVTNLLATFPQEVKERLDKEFTFQEFVTYVKGVLINENEKWKLTFHGIKSHLTDNREAGKLDRTTPKVNTQNAKLRLIQEREEAEAYFEEQEKQEYLEETGYESYEEEHLFAMDNPVGKQFSKELFKRDENKPAGKLFNPMDKSKFPCAAMMSSPTGVCTKTNCFYNHDPDFINKKISEYQANMKKATTDVNKKVHFAGSRPPAPNTSTFAQRPPTPTLRQIEEVNTDDHPVLKYISDADVSARADLYRNEVPIEEDTISAESERQVFDAIKKQDAPIATNRNLSMVHATGELEARLPDGRHR